MQDDYLDKIKGTITTLHEGDERQLEVIFSKDDRVIVEAPAGFGKTTTMISRIAYLYASGSIPNPQRVLALTFSVNAALKIKREIAAKLPSLLNQRNNPMSLSDKMTVTNYHGFCKSVLDKYGFLLSDLLRKNINLFFALGDEEIEKRSDISTLVTNDELSLISSINESIKKSQMPADEEISAYNSIVIRKLLPHDYITHNAVILMTLELFKKHVSVKAFYSNYYPLIIVDEFQDTNCIAWNLIEQLIGSNTKLLFLGDPLQRIYGFIGALPSLLDNATKQYSMKKVTLSKNYRFRNNMQMLLLDANIRLNAQLGFNLRDCECANIPAYWGKSQEDESEQVTLKVADVLSQNPESKVALLLRGRNDSVPILEQALQKASLEYFYGMFTDEDMEYVRFHEHCQNVLIKNLGKTRYVNSRSLKQFVKIAEETYMAEDERTAASLNKLLDALVEKVTLDYGDLQAEEKYDYLLDVFENRQLKQAMEYVDSPVILSTVHGAKGLEWDYVFIIDLEIWGMPGYFICKDCGNKYDKTTAAKCRFPDVSNADFKERMLDELSVFYVATTRARKQVFVSASQNRANGKSGKFSCFASLPGIKLVDARSMGEQ